MLSDMILFLPIISSTAIWLATFKFRLYNRSLCAYLTLLALVLFSNLEYYDYLVSARVVLVGNAFIVLLVGMLKREVNYREYMGYNLTHTKINRRRKNG